LAVNAGPFEAGTGQPDGGTIADAHQPPVVDRVGEAVGGEGAEQCAGLVEAVAFAVTEGQHRSQRRHLRPFDEDLGEKLSDLVQPVLFQTDPEPSKRHQEDAIGQVPGSMFWFRRKRLPGS
jgi:hypothetical protein